MSQQRWYAEGRVPSGRGGYTTWVLGPFKSAVEATMAAQAKHLGGIRVWPDATYDDRREA